MKAIQRRILAAVVPFLFTAIPAAAQTPRIVNAKIETRPAAPSLAVAFQTLLAGQSTPAWVGYAVPTLPGDRQICCCNSRGNNFDGENGCGTCRLENSNGDFTMNHRESSGTGTVALEGPRNILVLFRVSDKRVEKIRTFSDDCQLDAGGLPVIWFTGVPAAQSVAFLAPFAQQASRRRIEPRW